jgi:hypothetical protein
VTALANQIPGLVERGYLQSINFIGDTAHLMGTGFEYGAEWANGKWIVINKE